MTTETSPSRATLHMVARLHYESDLSQIEIARRLGVSGATVSRLLRRAHNEGIVRIEIQDLVPRENLTREVAEHLKLKVVSISEGASTSPLTELAAPVGELLKERLKEGAVLAIGWGRAIREIVRTGLPRIPGVIVVPATGGMQQPAPHFQINEFVRLAAEQLGGEPRFIHGQAHQRLAQTHVLAAGVHHERTEQQPALRADPQMREADRADRHPVTLRHERQVGIVRRLLTQAERRARIGARAEGGPLQSVDGRKVRRHLAARHDRIGHSGRSAT